MSKKVKEPIEETEIEETVNEEIEEQEEEIEEKVIEAKKVRKSKGAVENIIGDIQKPEDLGDKREVLAYLKKVDKKLDQIISSKKEVEPKVEEKPPLETPPKKKTPWYERSLF